MSWDQLLGSKPHLIQSYLVTSLGNKVGLGTQLLSYCSWLREILKNTLFVVNHFEYSKGKINDQIPLCILHDPLTGRALV